MATATTRGQNKTAFVRGFLEKDPRANTKSVNEAWRGAGHEGSLSSALVSNLRSDLGLPGIKRGGSGPAEGNDAAGSSRVTARSSRARNAKRQPNGRASIPDGGKPAPTAMEPTHRQRDRDRALEEIEADIDRLIFKLMAIGGLEGIEDGLRQVRRLLFRGHGA